MRKALVGVFSWWLAVFVCLIFLFSQAIGFSLQGKVVRVLDGDTIEVLANYHPIRVRLYGIDTPEKKQAFGSRAKQFTANLVFSKTVTVEKMGKDGYGRTVGLVYVDGVNVNKALIENGMAWIYRKYCTAGFCNEWLKLESKARASKDGLWSQKNPIAPWEWRHSKKFQRSSSFNQKTSQKYQCGSKRYCSEMTSCDEAMFYYKYCGLKKLDRDKDGIPCEKLCR